MNRSVVSALSVIGKMGSAEWHFPDDKKMGKAVTGLESESVTAHEVSNSNASGCFVFEILMMFCPDIFRDEVL